MKRPTLLLHVWLVMTSVCRAEIWPKPQQQDDGQAVLLVKQKHFEFSSKGFDSDILEEAFSRYSKLLFDKPSDGMEEDSLVEGNKEHHISELRVKVASNDQSLGIQTDESYTLEISRPHSYLNANTVFGALRGLESFVQLLEPSGHSKTVQDHPETLNFTTGHKKHKKTYQIQETSIYDFPRFQHRGLLIDTARHYLPIPIILEHLDAMAMSKLNVLHWHIVDDQSFPFVSKSLPRLSEEGAFRADLVYQPGDIRQLVEYARRRGIRVIPELDTPGHTQSWGRGYPDLLADCYDDKGEILTSKGPLDPTRHDTYKALWKLLQDLAQSFPDSYVHLGGDEVPLGCWKNNPDIQEWMRKQDPSIADMAALEEHFERKVLDLAAAAGRSYIVWQEIIDNGVQVQADTVVHVWKWWWPATPFPPETMQLLPEATQNSSHPSTLASVASRKLQMIAESQADWLKGHASSKEHKQSSAGDSTAEAKSCDLSRGCMPLHGFEEDPPAWTHELAKVTKKGHKTLLSSPWYLNLGGFASNDWAKYYAVEPLGFNGSHEQKSLVIGGEACMWGEYVDETNAIQRTWPRAAAVAERLWSDASVRDIEDARQRLEEHRCRLVDRGVRAEPLGPGYCP